MQIMKGAIHKPLRVVVYGPEGIGKTTFASQFPDPVFIDTEGGTEHMDVARFPKPSSWTMLLQEVDEIRSHVSEYGTLIIDTADWAEALCKKHVCSKAGVSGIEDFGFGKGYVYLAEEWGKLLNKLSDLRDAGLNIVITAHATMRKFEQPDEMGSYDRWELKLEKKTAPLLKEWSDMMLFANYETIVITTEEKKRKAQGGKRVMYTTHHPCWDAKNRQGLAEKLPFEYAQIARCVYRRDQGLPVAASVEPEPEPVKDISPAKEPESGLPRDLADLMAEYGVTEAQIQSVVSKRGYYPENTPICNYDPNFISGWLVGLWEQVYNAIKEIEQ